MAPPALEQPEADMILLRLFNPRGQFTLSEK
jgi:hypothetical protein